MDQKNSREEPASFINPTQLNYNYKGLTKRLANHDEYQSVFDEKAIRRYQIWLFILIFRVIFIIYHYSIRIIMQFKL